MKVLHKKCSTEVKASKYTETSKNKKAVPYLDNPDENFQLISVELEIHTVSQPCSYKVHSAGVPLL